MFATLIVKVAIHYYGRLAAKQGWRFDSTYDHKDETGEPIPFVFLLGSGKVSPSLLNNLPMFPFYSLAHVILVTRKEILHNPLVRHENGNGVYDYDQSEVAIWLSALRVKAWSQHNGFCYSSFQTTRLQFFAALCFTRHILDRTPAHIR